ncbi:MAG: GGDEF domain-containing protein, partial [Terriglobales bacterium]
MSRTEITLFALSWVVLVAIIDYRTGYEISSSVFYLPAPMLVAWTIGRRAGILFSVVSACAWGIANNLAGAPFVAGVQVWNSFVRFSLFVVTVVLLTEFHGALSLAEELARTDPLTRLLNQRAFYEMLEQELDRARRYARIFTISYIDLDHFKLVNDRHGHAAGDEALLLVATVLSEHLRSTDFAARLGGDEFSFVLPETAESAAATKLAELQTLLNESMRAASLPVTFSIVALTFLSAPESVTEAIRQADQLMYS